ncbi:hypothetical protein Cadr_000000324 [Camelus dromedarius]|uniref:Uncharacterized protein n=1 Tax=Camelus dromedarius TaxID=9838 RepID=A0A5N4EI74_CAMDR|nr:hypothetical protein Cadr_000000324 [Camelus dromedarius]
MRGTGEAGKTWALRLEGGEDKEHSQLWECSGKECSMEREACPHSRNINKRPADPDSVSNGGRNEMKWNRESKARSCGLISLGEKAELTQHNKSPWGAAVGNTPMGLKSLGDSRPNLHSPTRGCYECLGAPPPADCWAEKEQKKPGEALSSSEQKDELARWNHSHGSGAVLRHLILLPSSAPSALTEEGTPPPVPPSLQCSAKSSIRCAGQRAHRPAQDMGNLNLHSITIKTEYVTLSCLPRASPLRGLRATWSRLFPHPIQSGGLSF